MYKVKYVHFFAGLCAFRGSIYRLKSFLDKNRNNLYPKIFVTVLDKIRVLVVFEEKGYQTKTDL